MYKANKNIDHNGKFYAKDSEVVSSDPGFKDLLNAGHIVKVGAAPVSEAEPEAVEDAAAEPVFEDAAEEKKHGKHKSRR